MFYTKRKNNLALGAGWMPYIEEQRMWSKLIIEETELQRKRPSMLFIAK